MSPLPMSPAPAALYLALRGELEVGRLPFIVSQLLPLTVRRLALSAGR